MDDNKVKDIRELKESDNPVNAKIFAEENTIVEKWIKEGVLFRSWVPRYPTEFSKNSFCLVDRKNDSDIDIAECLCSRFLIKDTEVFKKKFRQAVSGNGNESMKIATLHSSSLLALLSFYQVSEVNPLNMVIDGDRYTFTESYFEVKTSVKDKSFSNMDIVLRGETGGKNGRKVLLFLESKFSEYLQSGKCDGIKADVYESTYRHLGLLDGAQHIMSPLEFRKEETGNSITISSSERYRYCKGIKQMLSHYIGISNFINTRKGKLEGKVFKYNDEDILLGEIIYQLPESVDPKHRFDKYKELYKKLADVINKNPDTRFTMCRDIFTYQDIISQDSGFVRNETIRKYYKF